MATIYATRIRQPPDRCPTCNGLLYQDHNGDSYYVSWYCGRCFPECTMCGEDKLDHTVEFYNEADQTGTAVHVCGFTYENPPRYFRTEEEELRLSKFKDEDRCPRCRGGYFKCGPSGNRHCDDCNWNQCCFCNMEITDKELKKCNNTCYNCVPKLCVVCGTDTSDNIFSFRDDCKYNECIECGTLYPHIEENIKDPGCN